MRPRVLARAFVALLAVSTAFPIVAGLLPAERVPTAMGLVDVAVAALTVIAGLALAARAQPLVGDPARAGAYRIVQLGSVAILALLGLFLAGTSIPQWGVLLAGLAWRAWLAIWVM